MLRTFLVRLSKSFEVKVLAQDEAELRGMLDRETPDDLGPEWDEPSGWSYTVEDPIGQAQTYAELPRQLDLDLFIHEGQALPRRKIPRWLQEQAEQALLDRRRELGIEETVPLLPGLKL